MAKVRKNDRQQSQISSTETLRDANGTRRNSEANVSIDCGCLYHIRLNQWYRLPIEDIQHIVERSVASVKQADEKTDVFEMTGVFAGNAARYDRFRKLLTSRISEFIDGNESDLDVSILGNNISLKCLTNDQFIGQYGIEISPNPMEQDDSLKTVIEQLQTLEALAEGNTDRPVETLKEVHEILQILRSEVGKKLEAVFNQWEGQRWDDFEKSRTIASMMDEAATNLGLAFQFETSDQQYLTGSLRCNRTGRDRCPTFQFGLADDRGRQIVRRASRALMRTELTACPKNARRPHNIEATDD